jgi:hypothetical protein
VKGSAFEKIEMEQDNAQWSLPFLLACFPEMRKLRERKSIGAYGERSGLEKIGTTDRCSHR